MDDSAVLFALADALEAGATILRQRAAKAMTEQVHLDGNVDVVGRARTIHPMLGHRQAEVLGVLAEKGSDGTSTGVISRAIGYDQPNVYLTLQGLITLGFVEKDSTQSPHLYRLTTILLNDGTEAA